MNILENLLLKDTIKLAKDVKKAIEQEYIAQGHNNTGRGLDSIDPKVTRNRNDYKAVISFIDYLEYINSGVANTRIPFSRENFGNRGGKSKYIEGLEEYFESKNKKDPLSVAFATAFTQIEKQKTKVVGGVAGLPTDGSFDKEYTKNGRRTQFVENADIERILNTYSDRAVVKISNRISDFVSDVLKGIKLSLNF